MTRPNSRRLSIEYLSLDEVKPAKRNPKDHDLPTIRASLDRWGMGDVAAIRDDRTGRIVAGHGRLEVLAGMHADGEPAPDGVDVDGDAWLVPVLTGVRFRNAAEADAFLIAHNRTGELGGWRLDVLEPMLVDLAGDDGSGLTGTGYTLDDLPTPTIDDPEPDTGWDLEPPAEPVTQFGDVWTLGAHVLVCGDTFLDATWDACPGRPDAFLTDPPYAIYGSSTGIATDIADDAMVRPFFVALFALIRKRLPNYGHAYVFCDWRSWAAIHDAAGQAKVSVKNVLVWDKNDAGLGSNFANTHEFVGFFANLPPQTAMGNRPAGSRSVYRSNILRFPRVAGDEREHNAAKPVEMLEELITLSTDEGDLVVDGFGGSGSTLIAAERSGRRCFVVDKDRGWCDVIAARFERKFGVVPLRNGEPHTFTETPDA